MVEVDVTIVGERDVVDVTVALDPGSLVIRMARGDQTLQEGDLGERPVQQTHLDLINQLDPTPAGDLVKTSEVVVLLLLELNDRITEKGENTPAHILGAETRVDVEVLRGYLATFS